MKAESTVRLAPVRGSLALGLAVLLALVALSVTGCYRSSADDAGESAHTETVDDATFTAVRDAIDAEGLRRGGRDVLMYRESDTRVRVEGEFTTEDGTRYRTVWAEREGDRWQVVEKE